MCALLKPYGDTLHYTLHLQTVNASNLCKILLGENISLRNKIPVGLPFVGFPPMTKQVTIFFFILSFNSEVARVLLQ